MTKTKISADYYSDFVEQYNETVQRLKDLGQVVVKAKFRLGNSFLLCPFRPEYVAILWTQPQAEVVIEENHPIEIPKDLIDKICIPTEKKNV